MKLANDSSKTGQDLSRNIFQLFQAVFEAWAAERFELRGGGAQDFSLHNDESWNKKKNSFLLL